MFEANYHSTDGLSAHRCHGDSDGYLVGGAPYSCHFLHHSGLGFVGGTLRGTRPLIGCSLTVGHADWVGGRGRGGAGGGHRDGVTPVGPVQRLHLEWLIPSGGHKHSSYTLEQPQKTSSCFSN